MRMEPTRQKDARKKVIEVQKKHDRVNYSKQAHIAHKT